jgi:phage shock protein PspC (stress-responsive transcriptional regulator)
MTKTLTRSSSNKVLGGVCAGLANYFNLDPTLVRVIFLVAFLGFGAGPLVYLILWLLMPQSY